MEPSSEDERAVPIPFDEPPPPVKRRALNAYTVYKQKWFIHHKSIQSYRPLLSVGNFLNVT